MIKKSENIEEMCMTWIGIFLLKRIQDPDLHQNKKNLSTRYSFVSILDSKLTLIQHIIKEQRSVGYVAEGKPKQDG